MIIDGFTLFGSWPGLPYEHTVDELISGLERFKVDHACTLSTQGIFFDAAAGNQTTITICRQNAHLFPIGVADPRMAGIEAVDFCQAQGFRLMALFPISQGWSLQSVTARAVLQRMAEAGMAVLIEAGRDGDASLVLKATSDLQLPVMLLDVSLRTITEAMSVLRMRPNTFLSTRLLCGGDTIDFLSQELGADRLIFSSRFPISCFSSAFLTAQYSAFNNVDRAAVMGGNMAKMLGVTL